MNINNAFPSKFLKSGDIPDDADLILTIREVITESVGQGEEAEQKPIVYFAEQEKGLVLNKTNANAIAGMYGPETDGWTGKRIALFATEVDFAGKQTLALRVRLKAPRVAPAAASTEQFQLPEVWPYAQAKAEMEKHGLGPQALKDALKGLGRLNAEGVPAYVAARDTELVKQLIANAEAAF